MSGSVPPFPPPAPAPFPPLPYIDVSDVRAVGIPDTVTDLQIVGAIRLAQAYIERAARQWFYPQRLQMVFDGTDSDALHLPVAIISVDQLWLNSMWDVPGECPLDRMYYRVYNNPADRDNPRIKLLDNRHGDMDIYVAPMQIGRMLFRKGRQNQVVNGTFGYTEPDGSVPEPIKRAMLLLTLEKLLTPVYVNPASPAPPLPPVLGNIQEEGTDGHYIKYVLAGGNTKTVRPSAWAGWTNNPEVLLTMKAYRSPIAMAAPANVSYIR